MYDCKCKDTYIYLFMYVFVQEHDKITVVLMRSVVCTICGYKNITTSGYEDCNNEAKDKNRTRITF